MEKKQKKKKEKMISKQKYLLVLILSGTGPAESRRNSVQLLVE